MARGGSRRGAGRPTGPLTKKTREIAAKALEEGINPLQVMLANMRHWHAEAQKAEAGLLDQVIATLQEMPREEAVAIILADVKRGLNMRELSQRAAADAARYIHAPVAPASGDKPKADHVPLHVRLDAYEREDLIKESANVVELKKQKRK